METTTPESTGKLDPAAGQMPEAIDPERDIDAKKTVIWLVTALVFVIVSLWILLIVFKLSLFDAEREKIELRPAIELRQLRSQEDYWLKKSMLPEQSDNRSLAEIERSIRDTTSAVIRSYVQKNN